MATVKPFKALRPKAELAPKICALPYDVMSTREARIEALDNPLSFLHVSKPEIDLPEGIDPFDSQVYEKGNENFNRLIDEGAVFQDPSPYFYLYRQIMGSHSQTGLVATASCQDYLDKIVKKHELTRPDKEIDRVRHIEILNSQTGPVFLTYRATADLDEFFNRKTNTDPAVDFTAADAVRHTAWIITADEEIEFIQSAFAKIASLYIADGHHRSAAAARVYQSRKGAGQSSAFLAVIFPHNQMQILPYNRVLADLNGHSQDELMSKIGSVCTVTDAPQAIVPDQKHQIGIYLAGVWKNLNFRPEVIGDGNAIDRLDVTLLQELILKPILGINDPRTSKRINFVGGIRGTQELESMVDSGEYACAFSMHPTSIEDLMTIADADGIMPPKSTWFEPKLRDAMFCHMI